MVLWCILSTSFTKNRVFDTQKKKNAFFRHRTIHEQLKKNPKNVKPSHIFSKCHIIPISLSKQGLDTCEQQIYVSLLKYRTLRRDTEQFTDNSKKSKKCKTFAHSIDMSYTN